MEIIVYNEVIINDDIEAMDSRKNLMYNAGNALQIASIIIIMASTGCKIAKFIKNKRKQAKEQEKTIQLVDDNNIDTTEEK